MGGIGGEEANTNPPLGSQRVLGLPPDKGGGRAVHLRTASCNDRKWEDDGEKKNADGNKSATFFCCCCRFVLTTLQRAGACSRGVAGGPALRTGGRDFSRAFPDGQQVFPLARLRRVRWNSSCRSTGAKSSTADFTTRVNRLSRAPTALQCLYLDE